MKYLIGILSVAVVILGFMTLNGEKNLGSTADRGTIRCNVSSVASAAIGHQVSVTVLAANSLRAWARITLVNNSVGVATSTPYLSFDEGAAATLYNGVTLATSTPSIDFGLNTDFAYVGAVTGITGVGSTTVQVTECVY